MIRFLVSIQGTQTPIGVVFQHNRAYKTDPANAQRRSMSRGDHIREVYDELHAQYVKDLATWNGLDPKEQKARQKPLPPGTSKLRRIVNRRLGGPEYGSGTVCTILDLTGVDPGTKLDLSKAKVLAQGETIMSRSDSFNRQESREKALKRAVNGVEDPNGKVVGGLKIDDRSEFWSQYWPARHAELARSWASDAVRQGVIKEEEREAFITQQTEKLAEEQCFTA